MDVFKSIIEGLVDVMRAEMGADIFTDAQRRHFERVMSAQTGRYEREIRQQYGKESHYCASADAMARAERNAAIIRSLMEGVSIAAIAERHGLTDRQIRKVRQHAIDAGIYKNGTPLP